ncbi:hypothetical protein GN956_G2286 [Arapaima gigas]
MAEGLVWVEVNFQATGNIDVDDVIVSSWGEKTVLVHRVTPIAALSWAREAAYVALPPILQICWRWSARGALKFFRRPVLNHKRKQLKALQLSFAVRQGFLRQDNGRFPEGLQGVLKPVSPQEAADVISSS